MNFLKGMVNLVAIFVVFSSWSQKSETPDRKVAGYCYECVEAISNLDKFKKDIRTHITILERNIHSIKTRLHECESKRAE